MYVSRDLPCYSTSFGKHQLLLFLNVPYKATRLIILSHLPSYFSVAGGDQGILNGFFSNWATADISKHLPFIYNLSSIAIYTYLPAFKQ